MSKPPDLQAKQIKLLSLYSEQEDTMNILEELYEMLQNEDTQEIHPHSHLNMVIIDPLKVSFVLTNEANYVLGHSDFHSGEPLAAHKLYNHTALPFSDMLGQLDPLEVTGYCLITHDEMIIMNYLQDCNFDKLIAFFPEYRLIKLSDLGSSSDLSVVAQEESIRRLANAIKLNFGTIKPE